MTTRKRSLVRHRDFMLLWSGQSASELGSQVSLLVLPLIAVTVLNATALEVSVLTALASVPYLLISLPAGVLVERTAHKNRAMLWCDVLRMSLVATIPIAGAVWHVTLWQLGIVALGVGALSVVFDIAYQSFLPAIVVKDHLVDANGRLAVTDSFARLAGPSLGGMLVGLVGAVTTVVVDSVSYAVSVVSLLLIRGADLSVIAQTAPARTTFRRSMSEGLRFVLTQPILRRIVAATATWNFFWSGTGAIRVVFLSKTLHAAPAVIGGVFAMGACGGLLGGAIAGKASERIGSARVIWLSLLAPGPLYLLLPLATSGRGVVLYGIGWFASSASGVIYNTAQVSYRQATCPPQLLSRMNASVRWLVWGTLPLGALAGGVMGTAVGLRPALWVCVLGTWAASLWLVLSPLRRRRFIDELMPAPVG